MCRERGTETYSALIGEFWFIAIFDADEPPTFDTLLSQNQSLFGVFDFLVVVVVSTHSLPPPLIGNHKFGR